MISKREKATMRIKSLKCATIPIWVIVLRTVLCISISISIITVEIKTNCDSKCLDIEEISCVENEETCPSGETKNLEGLDLIEMPSGSP